MRKLQITLLITSFVALITTSCNQTGTLKIHNHFVMKTGNYKTGDCFEFKDKIKDFGLVFLEENSFPDGKQYNLFPVQLDTTKNGMDKFKYGKVYISGFPDYRKASGRTDGFMVYNLFLNQENPEPINKLFTYVGKINIKDEYKNATGGTSASTPGEFRFQLNHWDNMFGNNGQQVAVSAIMQ